MADKQSKLIITQIRNTEEQITELKQSLVQLKKSLPREEIQDYSLLDLNGPVKLSSLFGPQQDLIVIHNMGQNCPYCTLWADGLKGVLQHLTARTAFVVVSPDDPAAQHKFAQSREWEFRMISGQGSTFTKDLGFETKDGYVLPGYSTFRKDDEGRIVRVGYAFFGPGDDYSPIWHMFELLEHGVNDWAPQFKY